MTLDTLLRVLVVVHGVMGAVDTLVNHELIERLPHRPEARTEIGLHATREAIYAALFGAIAWFAWHGAAAMVIAVLVIAEVIVSTCDEFVENKTRVLPQNERVLHLFLTLNLGLLIAVLTLSWATRPTALIPSHGPLSWILSVLAIAAGAWSVRDLLAWRRLTAAGSP